MGPSDFHPSELAMGERLREDLRFKDGFSENPTHRLDKAQTMLTEALAKHGDETLTKENYDKVMEHAKKSPHWEHLRSAGPALEAHLKARLGIKD